ncbi:hypothetical protein QE422_002699 [Chryseobacterium sp. SORGH_AS 447]|nr:hypothetical protein [Chryseobacterium sp. SORGH_AS_0447]
MKKYLIKNQYLNKFYIFVRYLIAKIIFQTNTNNKQKPGTDDFQWKNYPIHTSLFSHPLIIFLAVILVFCLPILEISETIIDFIIGIAN